MRSAGPLLLPPVENETMRTESSVASSIRSGLTSWWEKGAYPAVELQHSSPPVTDRYADYQIAHAFVFEPAGLNHLRVEIWITDVGYVAIGLETRERLAKRLQVKNWRHSFATGHEPVTVGRECLCAILDAVAGGRVAIAARVGILGLGATTAVTTASVLTTLSDSGCKKLNWIGIREDFSWRRIVEYLPWTSA